MQSLRLLERVLSSTGCSCANRAGQEAWTRYVEPNGRRLLSIGTACGPVLHTGEATVARRALAPSSPPPPWQAAPRRYGVAATASVEEYESAAPHGEANTIEVDAAAVADESLKVANCGLSQQTVQALESKGIAALFPIQKSVFDPAMAGSDLVARARTGSGKTLAFSLPIIEGVLKENAEQNTGRGARPPRAVILAPTRELAKQVAAELESATRKGEVQVATVYGGAPIREQIRQIERGIDVIVGTPGRVIDLVQTRRVLDFSAVKYFVLDEADEMLNMGFQEDVETILESVPAERQTMFFSATMPQWVRKLARKYCKDYIMVDLVGDSATGKMNEDITCLACMVPPSHHAKRLLLVDLITTYSSAGKTIVFCNTKRECESVVSGVSAIMPAEALHGDIAQDMREFTMSRFREVRCGGVFFFDPVVTTAIEVHDNSARVQGKTKVLVATDVAARGLDVNDVDLVVHWDVPQDSEAYLHRSGRTARAGRKGTAIVLFGQNDKGRVAQIMRDTKADLSLVGPPTPQQVIGAAARNIEKGLTNVNIDVAKYFAPIASRMLESGVGAASTPVQILAVTMAQMSGYTDLPKEKSILGQAEGALTLGINTPAGRGFSSPGALVGSLRRITSEAVAGSVGKVELFDEPEEAGYEAAFDVPKDVADEIIEAGKTHGATVQILRSLPIDLSKLKSYRDGGGNDRGRGRGRGGGRGYGGFSGSGGGGGGYGGRGAPRGRNNGGGGYSRGAGGSYGGGGGSYGGGGGGYGGDRSQSQRGRGGYSGGSRGDQDRQRSYGY